MKQLYSETERKLLIETAGKLEQVAEALRGAAVSPGPRTADNAQFWLRHLPLEITREVIAETLHRVIRGGK